MRIRVFDNPNEAGVYAAALAERVILERPQAVLGLATGRTPIPFYRALAQFHRCGLDLQNVTTINLDEYVGLPPDHPHSYASYMRQHLVSQTNVKEHHVYLPNGTAPDLNQECARYDAIIASHPVDFQILGIGVNGHVGFNEPDDMLLSKTHVVNLRPETIRSNASLFDHPDEVPKQAITVGMQAILQADQIVLLAFGEDKAEAVAKTVLGDITTDTPSSVLQLHRNVTLVLDHASAREVLRDKA